MSAQSETSKFRIMLFTDEPQLKLGATCLLSSACEFEIVGGPSKVVDLLPCARHEQPHVLLIDLSSEMTLAFFAVLHEALPECRIVLWAREISGEVALQARESGVAGIVRRTSDNESFVDQLKNIANGNEAFESRAPERSTRVKLTRRESQIVALLAQGLKNKEIGTCLGITEGTVKSYLVHLFQKVGARDRFELAVLGLKNAYFGQAAWDGENSFVTEPEDERARPFLRSLVLVEPARRGGYPEISRKAAGA
jgi:DNA-binding NarL/FixJ family response regulator